MEPSDPAGTAIARPTHPRWVGVLLSFLIPGAGIFLAGKRKAGLRWFLVLTALSLVMVVLAPLPAVPGLGACLALAAVCAVLTLWMLVVSYKPVPRLGVRGWLLFLLVVGLLGCLEALVPGWFARAFKVPTGSMEPTVVPGDRLFVQTSAYWFNPPQRGDVVVFRTDALESSELPKGQFYVKRVVGLPGEALRIDYGRLLVNERPLRGPAVLASKNFSIPPSDVLRGDTNAYVVPPACYFVVGDNVGNSLDSRHFGAVPRRGIIGRATKLYWPWVRAGDLR